MFGYVRPALSLLSPPAREAYQSAYCGMCHALGRRHGLLARFTLNYDFAFLGILFSGEGAPDWCLRRCPAHPLRKPRRCLRSAGLDGAADASMILTWHKLRDDVQDRGLIGGIPARVLCLFLARPFRRARAAMPEFSRRTEAQLSRLRELERQRSPALDRAADAFACILQAAAPEAGGEDRRRAMAQLLYHIGRWIYLVDAWDDLGQDRRQGRYNPLDARFEGRAEEEKDYVSTTMTHSLRLAVSAAGLAEFGQWDEILWHMLNQSLPAVQEAVLSGQWKELKKRRRENDQ